MTESAMMRIRPNKVAWAGNFIDALENAATLAVAISDPYGTSMRNAKIADIAAKTSPDRQTAEAVRNVLQRVNVDDYRHGSWNVQADTSKVVFEADENGCPELVAGALQVLLTEASDEPFVCMRDCPAGGDTAIYAAIITRDGIDWYDVDGAVDAHIMALRDNSIEKDPAKYVEALLEGAAQYGNDETSVLREVIQTLVDAMPVYARFNASMGMPDRIKDVVSVDNKSAQEESCFEVPRNEL